MVPDSTGNGLNFFNILPITVSRKRIIYSGHCLLLQEGCWGILDEFHRAPPAVVSVIFHYVQTVVDALKVGQTSCYVNEGKEVSSRDQAKHKCDWVAMS